MLEKGCHPALDELGYSRNQRFDFDCAPPPVPKPLAAPVTESPPVALNPRKRVPLKLHSKQKLSHDSFILTFSLQTPTTILGLPTGKHVFLSDKVNGKMVMRRYTPCSSDDDVGVVRFVIKSYPPCPPRFPNGGIFSQHLDKLKVGETIDFKGPIGEFHYLSNGNFTIDDIPQTATHLNMISGGTGITPSYQIISSILSDPTDATKINLVFACRNEGDLLLRENIDKWVEDYPDRFKCEYVLSDSSPPNWRYSTGFVNAKLFEKVLHPPSDTTWVLMCGPPIMLEKGCHPALDELGYGKDRRFEF